MGIIEPRIVQPLLTNPGLPINGQGPSDDFRGVIELFWCLSGQGQGRRAFHIHPDANFDLVFLLGDSCCSLLLAGPYTQKVTIPIKESLELISVRFLPGTLPPLADAKPSELVNGGIQLATVLGRDTDFFGERLRQLSGIDSKKRFLEAFFRKAGLAANRPENRSRGFIEWIHRHAGRLTVKDLSRYSGTSIRTLERIFLEEMGISPKWVIRFIRYQAALAGLRRQRFRSLADLACGCGYADQSHFTKEVAFFSGTPPGRL